VAAHPVLFSVEFRRKMAELPDSQRQQWLTSLAERLRKAPARVDPVVAQELREVARGCRLALVESVERSLGPFDRRQLAALLEVPRERFVRLEDLERSAEDMPLSLDDTGLSTISAPHAYLLSYRLLRLAQGDALVELGTGSGYGAALAAFIVGGAGSVLTFEIDSELVSWARRTLADDRNVSVVEGDAMLSASQWGLSKKVSVTFAIEAIPGSWVEALPDGGRLVAPVGPPGHDQRLMLLTKRGQVATQTDHGPVRYVSNRSSR
jgi:protein-L-isoaspartate(D-aspartate) O-methyltransferase